jgi:ABC-type branched-subunit amino acid transport system substrate-binding protein
LGRDVLRGAELVVFDSFGADREEVAVANARRAAGDGEALAYIGDFHSSQVIETAPVLGEADLLGVAPVATYFEQRRLRPIRRGGRRAGLGPRLGA